MSENNRTIEKDLYQVLFQRYPAEATTRLEQMDENEIAELMQVLPVKNTLKIWERLSPENSSRVLTRMTDDYVRELITSLDPNTSAKLLRSMSKEDCERYMDMTDPGITRDLRIALDYLPDSAGALMDTKIIFFRANMTVADALTILRKRTMKNYRKIYIVDDHNHLQSLVEIEELALADDSDLLSDIERKSPVFVEVNTTRDELVEVFDKYKLTDIPVVDFDRRLVGVVRYHALVEAALDETSADLQTMVGVSKEERALSPAVFAVKKRLPWLHINLLTAFMAAAVVGIFEDTIAKVTALAVLLPVVAGQSGNTGAQALAVTMRGLVLKEIYPGSWFRILSKEFNAGMLNGVAIAITTGIGVYIWSQSFGLVLIIFISMILSMIIASVSGAAIPILLTITGQDPAQSSSIFLTTVTDIAGFFSFLGIATLLITML